MEDLNIQQLEKQYFSGKVSKKSIVDKLILKIEYNNEVSIRIKSLETLSKLNLLSDMHFDYLENLAIADLNDQIRSIAIKTIIDQFYDKADFLINWIVYFENSPFLLNVAINSLIKIDEQYLKYLLSESITKKISEKSNKTDELFKKELKNLFNEKPPNMLPIDQLTQIFLNFCFILNNEKKYLFSENLNTSSLMYKLEEGCITELRVWGLKIIKVSDLEGINLLTELQILDLSGNNLKEIDGLINLSKLKLLKFGDLSYDTGNQISEIKGLNSLPNLKILNLSNNFIKQIKGIDNLKNLEYLYLVNNSISEIQDIENLEKLRYLNLEKNNISKIENIEILSNLETIVLNDNNIKVLENVGTLNKLREIRISRNPLSEIEVKPSLNNICLKLHTSEIERLSKLNGIDSFTIKAIGDEKPNEYTTRYQQ